MPKFVIVDDLRQYHLEDFEDEYWQRRDKNKREKIGKSTDEGLIVRAALAAGWFGADYIMDADERVKNMTPAQVVELATAVDAKRSVARAADPKSLWRLAIMYLGKSQHLDFLERLGALSPGAMAAVKVGENGELEILKSIPTASTSTTPVTATNEPQGEQLNGQKAILTTG